MHIKTLASTLLAGSLALSAMADITTGLVGNWKFDEGSGSTTADSSTSSPSNTGTLTNFVDATFTSMWTNDSWTGNAILFNQNGETTNYVNVPNATSFNATAANKQWTLAAWVKPSVAGSSQANDTGIICKGAYDKEQFVMSLYGGKIRAKLRNAAGSNGFTITGTTALKAGTWYHVVATCMVPKGTNNSGLIVYVNGIRETGSDGNTYTTLYNSTQPATIGTRANASGTLLSFQGIIDDARIYSRSLSATDILELYTNSASSPVITIQPRDVNCYSNDTAVFNVTAGLGARNLVPLSYQWQFNGIDIAGATASTLSVPGVTGDDAGPYTVVVSNYGGSVTSSPAMLTVRSLPVPDTTSGLVGWWKFDEANGSSIAADSSVGGNAGMLTNYVEGAFTNQWTTGINGGALAFNYDGSASNVVVVPSMGTQAPSALDFSSSSAFTLSAWVKGNLVNQTNEAAIVAKGTGAGGEQYVLEVNGGVYRFFIRPNDGGATVNLYSTTVINGNWQHVAGTVNLTNSTMSLYVNGHLEASTVPTTSLYSNTHEVSIGNRQSSATSDYNYPFSGLIDEVRIYSRDLSSADITALYGQDAFPIISEQYPVPYTNVFTLFAGSSPTLNIASVTGLGLSYQWYTNGVAEPGATNSSYHLSNLPLGGFTNYYCVVTNLKGAATSFVWSASVVAPPSAPYVQSVMALKPAGFWRLGEPDDTLYDGNTNVVAQDFISGNNGLYSLTSLGQQGYASALASLYLYSPATDPVTSAQFGNLGAQNNYAGQIRGTDFNAPNGTTTNFSVECWVNGAGSQVSTASILSKGIYAKNDAFSLSLDSTSARKYRFFVRTASGTVVTALSGVASDTGAWHHLVGVLNEDEGTVKLYIDGTNAATTAISTTAGMANASAYPMQIGSAQNNTITGPYALQFNGYINDVATYDHALTPEQIQANYLAAGFPPAITQNPVAATNLNEGTTLVVPAAASGGTQPVQLQWYDVTYGQPGTPVAGQTNATLVISNISAALYNGHGFALRASNQYGQPYSSTVYVTVQTGAPYVTVTPWASTVYTGVPVSFLAVATGTEPFTYQWSVDGAPISGATTSTYTRTATAGSHSVTCTVTGPSGPGTGTATITGVTHPTDAYAVGILADAPLAYWRLDEPLYATVANDYQGGHNAGYSNVTNGLSGFSGSDTAAGFGMNGIVSDSYALEQANSVSGVSPIDFSSQGANPQYSVEAWVKVPYPQISGAGIVTKGPGNGEQFNLDVYGNAFRFYGRDAAGATHGYTSTFRPDGNWHHVVGVYDGLNGLTSLYVDGALLGTTTYGTNLGCYPVAGLISIGSRITAGAYTYQLTNSVLDEVAIYGYALSSNQVAAHYTSAAMPPQIVRDLGPQMDATVGLPISLTVVATSQSPMHYQWQRNGTNLIDDGRISGSQTSTLSIGIADSTDSGSTFRLIITNESSTIPAVSTLATMTVRSSLGFNGYGAGWTIGGTAGTVPKYTAINTLQLTDGRASEASSSFFAFPVSIRAFQASFTYQDLTGTGAADGVAFIVQNDARGAYAVGGGGGGLGYNGITNSAALELNIYSPAGYAIRTNGVTGKPYNSSSPVDFTSCDPIDITLQYADGLISMTMTDAVAQTSYTFSTNIDIVAAVGGETAYVGFSGACGSVTSSQIVSNFTFVSLSPGLTIHPAANNQVLVSWPASAGGYTLQRSLSLSAPAWSAVTNAPTYVDGLNQVTLPAGSESSFYRLISGQ